MTIPPSLAQPSFTQAPIETTDPNAISKTIMDAKGDLLTATGADTPARLAVGTDGQVLVADSTQTTGLKWAVDPTTTSFDAKGDLLVGTGPDAYTRVPVGTNNQVLVADSAEASGVRWSSEQDPNAITKSIIDAKGDLIAGTAADTPARLAVGSDGQYLIADSTQTAGIKWAAPNITLGTETSGDYVAGVTGGTGVTVTGSGGETSTPSIAIGQAVGTGDTVAFGGLNVDSGTLYVDSTNNRVGINDTTPSYSLDVTGDGHFSTDLTVDGTVYAPHIHGDLAGLVYFHVKNTTASTIPNGTPVYITGTVGSTQVAEIAPADASNPAKMPAIGITDGDLIANANGHAVIVGDLDGQNTNAYSINQPLYVASGGGITGTRPTGASDIIQVVGHVARVNTNTGGIVVACGPSANTPNTISVTGNISTSAGYFSGSGSGLTNIPAGQLTGTVPSGNIGNDSVALGTKTTGDYVATVAASTGVTVTGGTGEGSTATISIGQAVGITDSPQFVGLTATGTVSANAVSVTNGVGAASATITGTTATSALTVDGIEIDTTGASANQVLKYNGTKFAPSTGASVTISDTAPTSPTPQAGDQWYESDTGRTFIYYDSVWVEIGNATDIAGALQPGQVTALSAVTSLTTDDVFPVVDNPSSATAANKITAENLGSQLMQFAPQTTFRNAIINGDFRINQRTWSSSTASATYGFDRWVQLNSGGTVTMSSQSFTVGSPAATGYEAPTFCRLVTASQSAAGDFAKIRQSVEDVRTFANSTVTVSFWAKASSGTPKVTVELIQHFGTGGSPSADVNNYAGQVILSTSWTRYSVTFAVPSISGKTIGTTANTSAFQVDLWTSAGSTYNSRSGSLGIQNTTIDFWGVQVERGSVATPFEQRPIQTELALCQRYFQAWNSATSEFNQIAFGNGYTATAIYPVVWHRPTMRVKPHTITSNGLRVNDVTNAYNTTSVTLDNGGTDGSRLNIGIASGGVQYRPYALETNGAGSYLTLSAEF